MVHTDPGSAEPPKVPGGALLRTYRAGDEQAWADIINTTDMGGDYDVAKVRSSLTGKPQFRPEGLFLACDAQTGKPLATACAWRAFFCGRERPTLHMVAARPEARGRGLGKLVCGAVLHYFGRQGKREVILTTDDHRLPALATYLGLGWLPMRYVRGEDHAGRWEQAFKRLSGKVGAPRYAGCGRPVTVAVFGLRRGADLAAHARDHAAGRVVAGCDKDHALRERFAARFADAQTVAEYDALLETHSEAVIVANDCPDHAAAAIQALAAGRDVLSEVTAFHRPEEGPALIEAVEGSGRAYMMGENCLYSNAMMELADRARQGVLGELQYAEGDYVHDVRPLMAAGGEGHWRRSLPALHYCTHPLGPILRAAGVRPVRVLGMHARALTDSPHRGASMGAMLIQTSGGAAVRILAGFAVQREPPSLWVCYYGTRASLETDRWQDKVYLYDPQAGQAAGPVCFRPTGRDGRSHTTAGHFGADARMMEYWLESLANGLGSPIDVYEAADMTLPGILGELAAGRGGGPIRVPDVRKPEERHLLRDPRLLDEAGAP